MDRERETYAPKSQQTVDLRLYTVLRKKVIVDTFIADINYGRLCNVHLFLLLSPVKSQIDG